MAIMIREPELEKRFRPVIDGQPSRTNATALVEAILTRVVEEYERTGYAEVWRTIGVGIDDKRSKRKGAA